MTCQHIDAKEQDDDLADIDEQDQDDTDIDTIILLYIDTVTAPISITDNYLQLLYCTDSDISTYTVTDIHNSYATIRCY